MDQKQRIEHYIQAVPKAELHVHLEGAIRPETLLTLAKRNNISLPVTTLEEARAWFTFRDFPHFVEIFFAISRCLKTYEELDTIDEILLNGVRHSFLPYEQKQNMEDYFQREMKRLKQELVLEISAHEL